MTTAGADGHFRFDGLPVSEGENRFVIYAEKDGAAGPISVTSVVRQAPCGFPNGLEGWTITQQGGSEEGKGSVSAGGDVLVMREGDSFNVTLERDLVVPGERAALAIKFTTSFDTSAPAFINDAFEVSVLDEQGRSLVQTTAQGRDAFFNATEGLAPALGESATFEDGVLRLPLDGIEAGSNVRLVMRLVNNDADHETTATIRCVQLGAGIKADLTKFYVVDGQAGGVFGYAPDGLGTGSFGLGAGVKQTGIAADAAGTTLWTVDEAGLVTVRATDGIELGAWTARDAEAVQDVAVTDADVWLVDRGSMTLRRYSGAAGRRSGATDATEAFALSRDNVGASGLVVGPDRLWVTDEARDEVFVYSLAGALVGRWKLDPRNSDASGITRDPTGGTHLWVVDRAGGLVYDYAAGTTLAGGAANATGAFALVTANALAEGIADPPAGIDPVVKWAKSEFAVAPGSNQVMVMPAVFDLNDDGVPDIVFNTYTGGNYYNDGYLRAVSGSDGADLWTVTDPALRVAPPSPPAVGDIDRDGQVEIIVLHSGDDRLLAFRPDGTLKWESPDLGPRSWGGISLADLDGDGLSEVIIDACVLNSDGSIRWSRAATNYGSIVVDLDRDGTPEIVSAEAAYRADGSVYWSAPARLGFLAVGNFDGDLSPELVLVGQGSVELLENDGTLVWSTPIPGGGFGGAPTVADLDNDGQPEIGVAAHSTYTVFEGDGSVRWQAPIRDFSSAATGSSVFDFDGDGSAEVVYSDERRLWIFNGSDGSVDFSFEVGSGTRA